MPRFIPLLIALALSAWVHAANVSLYRSTREVTPEEIAGGAPLGGFVHEFFVNSDSDLLNIGADPFGAPLYQHTLGSDVAAPLPDAIAADAALGVDSFITFPGATAMVGGGFTTAPNERAWFDTSNDGPQSNLLFARLTTAGSTGRFSGNMYVRGYDAPVTLPFNFALPGTTADLALLDNEPTYSVNYSLDPPPVVTPPPAPPQMPPVTPPPALPPVTPPSPGPLDPPSAPSTNPGPPTAPSPWESVSLVRRTRAVTADEVAGGAPAGGLVHDLFVSSASDLLVISADVDAPLFQHTLGSDVAPPIGETSPGVTADSFITLPSATSTVGGGFAFDEGEEAWFDFDNNGAQDSFQFARLTTMGQSGTFTGEIFVRGQPGVGIPYTMQLPGTEQHLAQLGSVDLNVFEPNIPPPVVETPPAPPVVTPPFAGPVEPTPPPSLPPVEIPPVNEFPEIEVPTAGFPPIAEQPPIEQPPAGEPPVEPTPGDPNAPVPTIIDIIHGGTTIDIADWAWTDFWRQVVLNPDVSNFYPSQSDLEAPVDGIIPVFRTGWVVLGAGGDGVVDGTLAFDADGASTFYAYSTGGPSAAIDALVGAVARARGQAAEAVVPEPSALVLLAGASVGLAAARRRPRPRRCGF